MNFTMLRNMVVHAYPKEHARTVIETHFFHLLLGAKHELGEWK